MENVANVKTTITRYIEVSFRHEVVRWITIKGIFKLSILDEILIHTTFRSTEYAKAFEKRWKYLEYLKSPSGRNFSTRSGPLECYLEQDLMI